MRKKGISHKCAAALLTIIICNCALANKIIYVDDDAAGANDGSSWQNAYIYLQDALANANSSEKPVEIRVAQGTYKPDQGAGQTTGDKGSSFILRSGYMLTGGYAGIFGTDPNERDYERYEAILSGDLEGNDIYTDDPNDLIDEPTRQENSYNVITTNWPDSSSILDGFTVSGGHGQIGPIGGRGGGRPGGGIHMIQGKLRVCNCCFTNNLGLNGAGIYVPFGQITLIKCIFKANTATNGGGIYHFRDGDIKLVKCIFENNFAENKGGGIYNEESKIIIEDNSFINNTSSDGGAIYLTNIFNDISLANSLFVGNSAERTGGAIYIEQDQSTMEITQSTFAQNTALHGKAIFSSAHTIINSSILFDGGADEIYNGNSSKIEINYSNIQNGISAIYDPNEELVWGTGNMDKDPIFADPNIGDYHLKSQAVRFDPDIQSWVQDDVTSPCIDTGDPNSPIGLEPFPNGGYINMGAYGGTSEASKSYFGKPVCETIVAGDINGDCKVDILDLEIMLLHWLEEH